MTCLSELFVPPDGLVGQVGITCAYSASQAYMARILENFTQRNKMLRKLTGHASLFLMLDPICSQLNPLELPGLVWLKPHRCEIWKRWVATQHAKVALLSFGKTPGGKPLCWRLIVSTGNWTEESGNQTIEMAWYLDANADQHSQSAADEKIDVADLNAAAQFLRCLITFYQADTRACKRVLDMLDGFIQKPIPRTIRPRFFASLEEPMPAGYLEKALGKPLFHSIAERFKDDLPTRNLVIAGSGFYEQMNGADLEPKSLKIIEDKLKADKVLQQNPWKYLVVNPDFCGQVACWSANSETEKWNICKPCDPGEGNRTRLHAKYIFVGKLQEKSERIDYGKLYVGSGNLSLMGVHSTPGISPNGRFGKGNIEAGVVFPFDYGDATNEHALYSCLACGDEIDLEKQKLQSGNQGLGYHEIEFSEPPPIARFDADRAQHLKPVWTENTVLSDDKILILNHDEAVCEIPVGSIEQIEWQGNLPNYVKVRWAQVTHLIPVLTDSGRFPSQKPSLEGLDDIFAFLANYPNNHQDDDDRGADDSEQERDTGSLTILPSRAVYSSTESRDQYPLFTSMKLVEFLADRNQQLPGPEFVDDWISQVSTVLSCLSPRQIQDWQSIGINFLDVLKQPDFCPLWQHDLWASFIDELARQWGLGDMPSIMGEAHV